MIRRGMMRKRKIPEPHGECEKLSKILQKHRGHRHYPATAVSIHEDGNCGDFMSGTKPPGRKLMVSSFDPAVFS